MIFYIKIGIKYTTNLLIYFSVTPNPKIPLLAIYVGVIYQNPK